jgi:hypothetical protein
MPRGLPKSVKDQLEKARQSCIAAVDAYNRPGPSFRTAQFIVLMIIAWTGLYHAIFYQRRHNPWYRNRKTGRYEKVGGEPKHWELSHCLAEFFGEQNPAERTNIEFLIELRNRIEHRHLPHLDATLFGECQATLINFEELLVSQFGNKYALVDHLSLAIQFSQLVSEERSKAIKSSVKAKSDGVSSFIESFRTSLDGTTLSSQKYAFSVYLVPRVANRERSADAAVSFVRVDEASPEELERLQRLNVLIRDKHIPIANHDLYKPSEVVQQVAARIQRPFSVNQHTAAWKYFDVRPPSGAARPEHTKARYCIYDSAHNDYVYTDAWVEKLSSELNDVQKFDLITRFRDGMSRPA